MLPNPSFSQREAIPSPQAENALTRSGFWKDNSEIGAENGLEKGDLSGCHYF